jgi:hypothetical protein
VFRRNVFFHNAAPKEEVHVLPYEVKTSWKFKPTEPLDTIWKRRNDSVEAPTQIEDKVYHTIRQMAGQIMTDHTLFGVLTTYKQWWFFKRGVGAGNEQRIYISGCYGWK